MLCKICGKLEASYRGECKVCGYKKRNKDNVLNVISDGFWCEDEIDIVIYHMLYNNYDVINNILQYLPNKTLSDLVNLLEFEMPIKGTAKNRVELQCFSCGEKLVRPLKHYFQDRIYCSMSCRDRYKTENLSGKNSKFYKRVNTICNNCGKEISVIPFDFNKTNSFGENNNFCSQQCYWEYRSRYYIGEKHPLYGADRPEELREVSRNTMLNNIKNGVIPQTMTKPHREIYELLTNNKIVCENEYQCKYHSIDIYAEQYDLMIEIMGDYWHANPLKYDYNDLNKQQLKDIKQDKSKHTYIKKYYNNEILYLWETDIRKSPDLCWQLILLFIHNNGILQNYHSFNYFLDNGDIKLSDNIIFPYFNNTESLSTAG